MPIFKIVEHASSCTVNNVTNVKTFVIEKKTWWGSWKEIKRIEYHTTSVLHKTYEDAELYLQKTIIQKDAYWKKSGNVYDVTFKDSWF